MTFLHRPAAACWLLLCLSLAAAPKTHKVASQPFLIEIKTEAVFEAAESAWIMLEMEAWSQLRVVESAEHGADVKKGDTILVLESEKLDEAIRDLEANEELAQLEVTQRTMALAQLQELEPLMLTSANQAASDAREDQKLFQDVFQPRRLEAATYMVKMHEDWLGYQEEELGQLEAMYGEDQMTEETEEIVLKRQRDVVERARFELANARQMRDLIIGVSLPREERDTTYNARQQQMTSEHLQQSLPVQIDRQKLELAKLKRNLSKQRDKLAKLRRDRAKLVVTAPLDGLVYHGYAQRGDWNTGVSAQLRPGGKLPVDTPIMTVVAPASLTAVAQVPEQALRDIQPGMAATIQPLAAPEPPLNARIATINPAPISKGNIGLSLTMDEIPDGLTPGLRGQLRIVAYYQPKALTVPTKSVFTESTPEAKSYVWLAAANEEDTPAKRYIEPGRQSGDLLEVLDGLAAGDTILLQEPENGS